jgi:hypothetical protein
VGGIVNKKRHGRLKLFQNTALSVIFSHDQKKDFEKMKK